MNELTCKGGRPAPELAAFKHSPGYGGKTGWVAFISPAMKTRAFPPHRGATAQLHKVKVVLMFPEGLMLKKTEGCVTKS